jgi:hypothetical protein
MPTVISSSTLKIKDALGVDQDMRVNDDSGELMPHSVTALVKSILSTDNVTVSTLGSNAVYTGTGEEVIDYSSLVLNIISDQNSATNGLSVEFSSDNTNWDKKETYTLVAGVGYAIECTIKARYFRVVYTNGSVSQGSFRLQTIFRTNGIIHDKTLSGNVKCSIEEVKSTIPVSVTEPKSTTATLSNVSGSVSSGTLLASNSSRLGATIFNDSTADLYVKFGVTAATNSFTVKILAGGYYEVPFRYNGRIDGIWSSATGAARITELT